MKISFNWLKEYFQTDKSVEEIADILTGTGLEVEGIEEIEAVQGGLRGVVLGEVQSCEKHPGADKLSVTSVDIGSEIVPIVCGAPNVAKGQKVLVATVGTTLYPSSGEPFKIKKAKIRGEVSIGMICAEDELGLGASHDGIMVLNTAHANGTEASTVLELENDTCIEIGLTPNRADATSHIGVARDLKAYLEQPVTWPSIEEFKEGAGKEVEVIIENEIACPHFTGVVVKGVTVEDSPEWLQNRLKAIGLTPINNVVDITNYVLHETGHPLHAYDLSEIKGDKVMVKNLPEGTPFVTLDEEERKLNAFDLMICNGENEPVCIGGVFGGATSGVTEKTKDVFLECAYFDPAAVRKTAMSHGLKTDASFRYERGVDPNTTLYTLKRAAMLMVDLAKGEVGSKVVSIGKEYTEPTKVTVSYANINRLIGIEIPKDKISRILEYLDIEIVEKEDAGMTLLVPAYRVDVQREADVIEEILRIYGFNNVALLPHNGSEFLAEFPEVDVDKVQDKITAFLVDNGFFEVMTNSLTKPGYADSFGYAAKENVEIKNKLSEDLGVMRQSLLFTGLEVVAYNINRKQKDLRLFEFGNTYTLKEGTEYKEAKCLSLYLTGDKMPLNWVSAPEKVSYHDLAKYAVGLLSKLTTHAYSQEQFKNRSYEYGLKLLHNNKEVLRIGKVSKGVSKIYSLKQPVFVAEFNWDLLLSLVSDNIVFSEVSKFPEVKRDLSLVVDKTVTFEEIETIVRKVERKLISQIEVFDVYEGDKIDSNKKAYAMSFTLQDKNKTLTDKVIDKTMNRLMQSFEKEIGALIRR